MANTINVELLPCDGCGQLADSAHISRRLERLAWSTRYRPLHIQALLVSGIAPSQSADFLYSPNFAFNGEGGDILRALQMVADGKKDERGASPVQGAEGANAVLERQDAGTPHAKAACGAPAVTEEGKSVEGVQIELQKLGIMLVHILECPLDLVSENGSKLTHCKELMERQLPATIARIRRSLKPKRVLLLSADLVPYASRFHVVDLGCPVLPSAGGVFLPAPPSTEQEREAFRNGLALSNPRAV